MDAEIFFHPNDQGKLQEITDVLSRRVYPGINVTCKKTGHQMGEMWGGGSYKNACRYVQLLLASLSPDRELVLGAKEVSYGFYIYSSYFGQNRAFQAEGARVLFPAVAVNDRMVLVPEKLVQALTASEGIPLFKPLEWGGLLDIDFNQAEQLDQGAQKVGEALRIEAAQMVHKFAAFHPQTSFDLNEVAKALGFDQAFLGDALKHQAESHTFYGQLTCSLSRRDFAMNRWTRATLTIANASEVGLTKLIVDIRGPVRIRPERMETDVPALGTSEIDIAIQPQEEGEFPLEVVLTLPDDRALRDWLPITHLWLTTDRPSSSN
jgi:hypothetical protein